MNEFIISPEDCLILKAFKEAESLRDAAKVLSCDPAGLLRKVQRISDDHGFLQKINGRWALTTNGMIMANWVEESITSQQKALLGSNTLRFSSTAWMLEEFLIPHLKDLKAKFPEDIKFQFSSPLKSFEAELLEGKVDYIVVCHPPEDPAIAHKALFKEEWVVVAPMKWKEKNQSLNMDSLMKKSFIRHGQVNPDLFGLNSAELTSLTGLVFDSLISVRAAIKEELGWSVVPKILVHDLIKAKKLAQIDFPMEMDRKICLWWMRNRTESKKNSTILASWLLENQKKLKLTV
jgi:DNA-binding transcriptional LysR family regulator